jgi:hypothetical protein
MQFLGCGDVIITNNNVWGSGTNGIMLNGSELICTNNTIKSWNLNHATPTAGYGAMAISAASLDKSTISNNICLNGGDATDLENYGVWLTATGSTVANGNIFSGNAAGTRMYYAFYVPTANAKLSIQSNVLSDNVYGFASGPAYTSSIIRGNPGWKTENSGYAKIENTKDSVNITHSLSITPARVMITATQDNGTNRYWVKNIGASTFTIKSSGAVTDSATFGWRACIEGN